MASPVVPDFVRNGRCTVVLVGAEWDSESVRLRSVIPRTLPTQTIDFAYVDADDARWESWCGAQGIVTTPTIMAWSGGRLFGRRVGARNLDSWLRGMFRLDDAPRNPGAQRLFICGAGLGTGEGEGEVDVGRGPRTQDDLGLRT